MPRGVVDGVRAFHRDTPRLLVHVFAVAELRLDDVDLFHVLESRGPLTGLETYDAADDLGQPLQHDEDAGHGNHRLERRSEEHTSELQSRLHLVCRLLLEKKKQNKIDYKN